MGSAVDALKTGRTSSSGGSSNKGYPSFVGEEQSLWEKATQFLTDLPKNLAIGITSPLVKIPAKVIASVQAGITGKNVTYNLGPYGSVNAGVQVEDVARGDKKALVKNAKENLGLAGEATLSLFGGSIAKEGIKATMKEVSKQGIKQLATKKVAKRLVADYMLGAGLGSVVELQNPENTPESVITAGAFGGVFGVAAPRVLGGVLKVAGKGATAVGARTGSMLRGTAEKLEKYAKGESTEITSLKDLAVEWGKTTEKTTRNREAAASTAKFVRGLADLPANIRSAFFTKHYGATQASERARAAGDDSVEDWGALLDQRQMEAKSSGDSLEKRYLKMKEGFDTQTVSDGNAMYLLMDRMDRMANPSIAKKSKSAMTFQEQRMENVTLEELDSTMKVLEREWGPERAKAANDYVKGINGFFRDMLDTAVRRGIVSKESAEAMVKAHPNYLPNVIKDFIDAEIPSSGSGAGGDSFSRYASFFKKAEGSSRELANMDRIMVEYISRMEGSSIRDEAGRTVHDMFLKSSEKTGLDKGMTLRSVTNVKQRIAYYTQLRDTKLKMKESIDALRGAKAGGKEMRSMLLKQQKELQKEEDELFKTIQEVLGEHDDPELFNLYERMKADRDVVDAGVRPTISQEMAVKNESLMIELIGARPGERIFQEGLYGDPRVTGVSSTFPKWIPKNLRKKLVLNSVVNHITKGTVPAKNATHEIELYNLVAKKMGGSPLKPLPTNVSGRFLQRFGQKKAKLTAAERRVNDVSSDVEITHLTAEDLNMRQAELTESIVSLKEQRKRIFEDVKQIRDKKIKAADYEKMGYVKINYHRDGIREEHLVPKDLGSAMRHLGGTQTKALIELLQRTTWGKIVTAPTNITRNVAVVLNPVFQAKNLIRDAMDQKITGGVLMRDYGEAFGQMIGGKGEAGKEIYEEAQRLILNRGTWLNVDQPVERVLHEQIARRGGILSHLVHPIRAIKESGDAIEKLGKLAAFNHALREGMNPRQAASFLQRTGVNAGRSGYLADVINTVIPFFNPAIQGTYNLAKLMKREPTEAMRRIMWSTVAPATILYAYNRKYSSYDDIPDFEKRLNFIIMMGESNGTDSDGNKRKVPHYIKIPKGHGQIPFASTIERMFSIGEQKYPQTTKAFMTDMAGQLSPIMDVSDLIPPGVKQMIELASNHDFFRKTDIVKEYSYPGGKSAKSADIEPRYQYNSSTSEVAKALGDLMNWSPMQVDHWLQLGVLSDLVGVADTVMKPEEMDSKKKPEEAFPTFAEIPGLRHFIGTKNYGFDIRKKEADAAEKRAEETAKVEKRLGR